MRAATLTASPNTSLFSSRAGPKWKPMRIASGLPSTVMPSVIPSCISAAACAASSAVLKVDMTSSPMVLTTRPPWRVVASDMRSTHFAIASRAFASP
jgi:hypothetical protein